MSQKIINFQINILPIFEQLMTHEFPSKELLISKKKKLCQNISEYSKQEQEIVYLLIACFCVHEKLLIEKFPFGSNFKNSIEISTNKYKSMNPVDEIVFNIENFPLKLKYLLYFFDEKIKNIKN